MPLPAQATPAADHTPASILKVIFGPHVALLSWCGWKKRGSGGDGAAAGVVVVVAVLFICLDYLPHIFSL